MAKASAFDYERSAMEAEGYRRAHVVLSFISITVLVLGLPWRPAMAQAPQTPPGTPSPEPVVNVRGTGALVFIGAVTAGITLLWFVPLLLDTRQANRWRSVHQTEILRTMVDASIRDNSLSVEDIRQIVSAMDQPPRGAAGLTQSLLALVIASLVAVALVLTLVSTSLDSGDLRKTIVTSLLSVLATIAGFYFGARTAQTSTERATRPPAAHRQQPDAPSRGGRTPDQGASTVTGDPIRNAPAEPPDHDDPGSDEGGPKGPANRGA